MNTQTEEKAFSKGELLLVPKGGNG